MNVTKGTNIRTSVNQSHELAPLVTISPSHRIRVVPGNSFFPLLCATLAPDTFSGKLPGGSLFIRKATAPSEGPRNVPRRPKSAGGPIVVDRGKQEGMSLPEARIRLAKRLHGFLVQWDGLERQWASVEVALENLGEQQAAGQHCPTFGKMLDRNGIESSRVLEALQHKIGLAVEKTEAIQGSLLGEMEALQKRFYQLRQEIEKSLQGNIPWGLAVSWRV